MPQGSYQLESLLVLSSSHYNVFSFFLIKNITLELGEGLFV